MTQALSSNADIYNILTQEPQRERSSYTRIWQGGIRKTFRLLIRPRGRAVLASAKAWQKCLERVERIPVTINTGSPPLSEQELETIRNRLNPIIQELERYRSKEWTQQAVLLRRYLASFELRMSGKSSDLKQDSFQRLEVAFAAYKGRDPFAEDKEVTDAERKRLAELCDYPDYLHRMLECPSWTQHTFDWMFRNKCPAETVIRFPHISDLMRRCLIARRVGYHKSADMRVSHLNNKVELMLRFDGQFHSIMNPRKEIDIQGTAWTVDEVFQEFNRRRVDISQLEFFNERGILPWDPYSWSGLLQDPEGWKKLPTFEIIEAEDVRERFGLDLKPGEYAEGYAASRSSADFHLFGTHGFTVGLKPTKDGRWEVFPFGKFMRYYPQNFLQLLGMGMRTVAAAIMYPDENIYPPRNKIYRMEKVSREGFKNWIKRCWEDARQCHQGGMPFNFWEHSCLAWGIHRHTDAVHYDKPEEARHMLAQEIIDQHKVNVILDDRVQTPLANVLRKMTKILPFWLVSKLFNLTTVPFGSLTGLKVRDSNGSLVRSYSTKDCKEFWDHKRVPTPGLVWEINPCGC